MVAVFINVFIFRFPALGNVSHNVVDRLTLRARSTAVPGTACCVRSSSLVCACTAASQLTNTHKTKHGTHATAVNTLGNFSLHLYARRFSLPSFLPSPLLFSCGGTGHTRYTRCCIMCLSFMCCDILRAVFGIFCSDCNTTVQTQY